MELLEGMQKPGTLDLADIFTIFVAVDAFTRTNKTGPNNHPAYLWVRDALDPMVHAINTTMTPAQKQDRERSCLSKMTYHSVQEAESKIAERRKHGQHLKYYQCRFCPALHLTKEN